jgi:hypothetical protein
MKRALFPKHLLKRLSAGIVLVFLSANFLSAQTRTLRIVTYNIQCDTTGIATVGIITPTCGLIEPYEGLGGTYDTNCTGSVINGGVLEGIGEEVVNGDPAQPIDILALEETTSNPTTVQPIVNALNSFYSVYNYLYSAPAGYAMSPYQATQDGGNTGGNGPNALVYNTNTVQLLASAGIATPTGGIPNGNGMYRQCVRYEFAPAGVTPGTNNEFYVYVSHYKASTGLTNELDRLGEAQLIRNDESLHVPANAGVLYVGDYNPDNNSGEPAYQTICSNAAPNGIGQGQGVDPLNIQWSATSSASPNINWSSSTTSTNILFMLSEESYELRYRDDLQVMTSNVYYQVAAGLHYVPGTYHSFGNNATLSWGKSVNTGGNAALNDLDAAKANATGLTAAVLLQDLTGASDHLPIVADYTIPLPRPVIASVRLAGNNLSLNVTNGITNAVYTVLTAPTLATSWTPAATNIPATGNFTLVITNAVRAGSPQQFYLLQTR